MEWLTRVPTAVEARTCALLTVCELFRLRCASRVSKALTELPGASPPHIGLASHSARAHALAHLEGFEFGFVSERDRSAATEARVPSAPRPWSVREFDALGTRLLDALPTSLLTTLLEVDQARVDQLGDRRSSWSASAGSLAATTAPGSGPARNRSAQRGARDRQRRRSSGPCARAPARPRRVLCGVWPRQPARRALARTHATPLAAA